MNGVSEALLEELLAQSKAQTQILQQLAKGFTGGSGSGGSGGGIAGSFVNANIAVKALSAGFNLLSGIVGTVFKIFGSIVGTAVNLVSAFNELGKKALTVGIGLSDLFKTLSNVLGNIPILGQVLKFFTNLVDNANTVLNSYRNLAKSGATFGGTLTDVVQAAKTTSLTLGELNQSLAANSKAFAILGAGDVQKGFDKFIATQNRLIGPDSEYRRQLLGLGLTAEESAKFLGTFTRSQGVLGKNREIDEAKLAKQTNDYILQLDALTRLTGIQKDELDATIRAAQEEQLFQTFLETLDEDQRRVANEMISAAAAFGPEAVREVQARLRGLDVPVTEFGKSIAALSNGMALDGRSLRDVMRNATQSTDGFAVGLEFWSNAAGSLGNTLRSIPQELLATGVFQKIPQSLIAFDRAIREKGLPAALEEIRKRQKEAGESNAGALADANLRVQELGLTFANISLRLQGIFYPVMLASAEVITGFIEELTNVVDVLTSSDGFKQAVKDITDWFKTSFREISTAFSEGGMRGGFAKMFDKMAEGVSNIWEVIRGPVTSIFEKIVSALTPIFQELMINLEYYIDHIIDKQIGGLNEEKEAKRLTERDLALAKSRLDRAVDEETKLARQQELLNAAQRRLETLRNVEGFYPGTGELRGGYEEEGKELRSLIAQLKTDLEPRSLGTVGMTGNWWEKETKPLLVHEGESVVTPEQMSQIANFGGQNNLANQVDRLNNLTSQMLEYLKQTAENTERTHRATASLNGNLYAQ